MFMPMDVTAEDSVDGSEASVTVGVELPYLRISIMSERTDSGFEPYFRELSTFWE